MPSCHKKSKRKRGVILSPFGWQRLQNAQKKSEIEANDGQPYTLEDLNQLAGLSLNTLTKVRRRKAPVDQRSLENYFSAFNLTLTPSDYIRATLATKLRSEQVIPIQQDWGEAIDVSVFYGRTEELATLKKWIQIDRCRLMGVLGIGGVGKTALAVKIAQQIQEQFEYVIWRSLRNAPPLETLLRELVPFLSQQQETEAKVGKLLQCLRSSRCLIILDNLEAILQAGEQAGQYRPGYEEYGELLRLIGETAHQSCLLLTSREKPAELATFESIELSVRSLHLGGSGEASLAIIQTSGLVGSEQEQQELCDRYGCNPLALKIVATSIQELFDGEIGEFLAQDTAVFNGIQKLLDQQFHRLSPLEKTIMYWLAINREWTKISELATDVIPVVSKRKLLEALESLRWRSLIEQQSGSYTQQPVVMEYIIARLTEQVYQELAEVSSPLLPYSPAPLPLFHNHALIKTTVKDYVRESQIRLILEPIADQLCTIFQTSKAFEKKFQAILDLLREESKPLSGYAGGNLINLYHQLNIDLTGYDFSNINVWQAYLQDSFLNRVNFENSDLAKSVFTQTFGVVFSAAFSPNGQRLVTGDDNGNLYLWGTTDGQLHLTIQGHATWVWCLAWSPDGQTIASGSADQTVKLWHPETGECLRTFQGHSNWVRSIAWNPNGHILASGSTDQTVKLWDVHNGLCLKTMQMQDDSAWSVAWSPNGQTLASGGHGKVVRLWKPETGECLRALEGHTAWVRAVAWSPDGHSLASGSDDQTVKMWDEQTGKCLKTFQGHSNAIWSVKWSPVSAASPERIGQMLASSSHDCRVRIWDTQTGQCHKILQNHTNWVWSVEWSPVSAASPEGISQTLVSVAHDRTIRLWDAKTGHCLKTWQGYTSVPMSVDWSPVSTASPEGIGQTLATCSDDQTVRLWNAETGQCIQILRGHSNVVWTVAWSPDSRTIASGGDDCTVRLWDAQTGECLNLLKHQSWVWSVAWSPDGQTLASVVHGQAVSLWDVQTGECLNSWLGHDNSIRAVRWSPDGRMLVTGSDDRTAKLWDVSTAACMQTLPHANWVWSVAWSPHDPIVVTGCADHTVNLWNINNGECLKTWKEHSNSVRSVAWSPDGQYIASGSDDQTVKLWHVKTGQCLHTLQGHSNAVVSVAWKPDGKILVSSSADETMKLWRTDLGVCLTTLRADRPYEGMNITGVTGLTNVQKTSLKALGAVEQSS